MKVVLFANTEWYLFNFRRSLAEALRAAGHEVLLVSPPGPYGARLEALGFRWVAAPMDRRSLNPFSELRLLGWLRGLLRRERVDLVHGFTIKSAVYGGLAARAAGVPARVSSVAGLGYVFIDGGWRARLLRPVVRLLLAGALGGRGARLIVQNPDDALQARSGRWISERNIRVIRGSGVDCTRFVPREGARDASAPVTFLLPARILWDKGVGELVEATRTLRSEGRTVRVLLAGDPDPGNPAAVDRAVLQGWVDEGVIEWLGHVDDMPALLREVDAVVLPSYREGLPKGLIEAAAAGLPLIATDVPGCREVVHDGMEGLLVPARDAPALARAMARLADDADLRARMGRTAREHALTAFADTRVVAETLNVYREVAPGR